MKDPFSGQGMRRVLLVGWRIEFNINYFLFHHQQPGRQQEFPSSLFSLSLFRARQVSAASIIIIIAK